MNIDDLLCIGAIDNYVVSNTIGRNAHRVNGTILKEIIEGYEDFVNHMKQYDINISLVGGETADVGDLVSTIIVDSTIYVRMLRDKVINCANITPGNVIVGLSSSGQATYEKDYNSGISSNGFTAARHLVLDKYYAKKYPETFSNTIELENVYCGKYRFEDILPNSNITIGQALVSPTRTYTPIIKEVVSQYSDSIYGIINCTGGGQVKCKSFGMNLHYIKDNLFDLPPIFQLIKNDSQMDIKEMFKVFNMGHRLEIYCDASVAEDIINISQKYNVEAKIIGRVEEFSNENNDNKVTIFHNGEELKYI